MRHIRRTQPKPPQSQLKKNSSATVPLKINILQKILKQFKIPFLTAKNNRQKENDKSIFQALNMGKFVVDLVKEKYFSFSFLNFQLLIKLRDTICLRCNLSNVNKKNFLPIFRQQSNCSETFRQVNKQHFKGTLWIWLL